jgi:4-hydroxy-tetrahydrodipicolinate synthase
MKTGKRKIQEEDMIRLQGSWVAMPTPFTEDDKIDFKGFETLINRQIKYGTSQLFVLGSAGEVTLLTLEEKKQIVHEVIKIANGRIPVFFSAASLTTDASVEFAQYIEQEGGDGVIFTVPPYVLVPQTAAFAHLDTCMSAVSIPCGIYNNPSRLGVQVSPESIHKLSERHENFVVDKEALGSVEQLVQVQRLCQGKVKIMCCDFPKYSIVIPTLAIGGTGTANIGGNIIPEEAAKYSRPWTSMEIMEECREEYFKWFPLLQELYTFSNPIVIKAALNILGLPGGHLRKPYQDFGGSKLAELEKLMGEMGVIDKYGVK